MLLAYLINVSCANISQGDACHKASEAFIKQTGLEQNVGAIENYGKNQVMGYGYKYLGDDVMKSGAAVAGVYHSVVTRSVSFRCPTAGLADSISTDLNQTSGKLTIQWKF